MLKAPPQSLDVLREAVQAALDTLTFEADVYCRLFARARARAPGRPCMFTRQPIPVAPDAPCVLAAALRVLGRAPPTLMADAESAAGARLIFDMDQIVLTSSSSSGDEDESDSDDDAVARCTARHGTSVLCWAYDEGTGSVALEACTARRTALDNAWSELRRLVLAGDVLFFVVYNGRHNIDRLQPNLVAASRKLPSHFSTAMLPSTVARCRQIRGAPPFALAEIEPTLGLFFSPNGTPLFDLFCRRPSDYRVAHLGLFHSTAHTWRPTESERRVLAASPPPVLQLVADVTAAPRGLTVLVVDAAGKETVLATLAPSSAAPLVRHRGLVIFTFSLQQFAKSTVQIKISLPYLFFSLTHLRALWSSMKPSIAKGGHASRS